MNTTNTARIKLLDYDAPGNNFSRLVFYKPDMIETVRDLLARGCYITERSVRTEFAGEAAAEEMFDLTNNPSREDEREQLYGRGRSVSVGDIIEVAGENWVCCPMGWRQV